MEARGSELAEKQKNPSGCDAAEHPGTGLRYFRTRSQGSLCAGAFAQLCSPNCSSNSSVTEPCNVNALIALGQLGEPYCTLPLIGSEIYVAVPCA